MNKEEKLYFEILSKQCREAWTIFKNPMYRGALEIAQNLYKDKAHFVYELLQMQMTRALPWFVLS